MTRPREDGIGIALLDDARGVHDVDAVGIAGHDAEIMRDDDQRDVEPARELLHQLQDLRLDGDVERRRRLVGDDELGVAGKADGDHHALAHAAGELVRILVEAALGIGDADQAQQLDRARARRRFGHLQVDEERLHDLQADRQDRVERGHGLLEDHRDVAAADLAHFLVRERQQVAAFEQDAAADDAAGGARQQAHDGERRNGFAAAGFTDQRYDLARAHLVRHTFHGTHDAARGHEMDV